MALALAFGLMMVAALGSVLGLAFYAGTANTRQLLADRTNLLLDTLDDRVEILLKPVEEQLKAVVGEIADAELDPTQLGPTATHLARDSGDFAAGGGHRLRDPGSARVPFPARPGSATGGGLVESRQRP